MALPTKANVQTLDYVSVNTGPFVKVAAKGTETEGISINGLIFVLSAGAAASGTNVFVNISGTWKEADSVHVNVGGTWKNMSEVKVNVGGTWKSV